jgi:hypothetical protein
MQSSHNLRSIYKAKVIEKPAKLCGYTDFGTPLTAVAIDSRFSR